MITYVKHVYVVYNLCRYIICGKSPQNAIYICILWQIPPRMHIIYGRSIWGLCILGCAATNYIATQIIYDIYTYSIELQLYHDKRVNFIAIFFKMCNQLASKLYKNDCHLHSIHEPTRFLKKKRLF